MIEAYAEYGAIGVIIMLFIGMIKFLQTSLTAKLTQVEGICVKLIDRWNRSDETRDRRHEDMMKEVDDLSDKISYMSGRLNGSGKS